MLKRIFKRELSWREVVAMAVLITVVIVLGILDANLLVKKWQKYQDGLTVQAQLMEEGVPQEILEEIQANPAFLNWAVNDLGDEDGGILNLDQDSGLTANAH